MNGVKAPEEDEEEDEDAEMEEEDVEEAILSVASTSAAASPRQFRGTLSDLYNSLKDADSDPQMVSVIVLLDARDPASWRVSELEREVRDSKCSLVIALTKCDLVPLEVVAAWTTYLSSLAPVFPICTPEPAKHGRKARAGGGVASLVAHLESICPSKAKEECGEESVALVGIENSGRTTLANVLAPLLPSISIFDTPSIVLASSKLANLDSPYEDDDDEEEDDETLQRRDEEAAHRILIRNSGSIFKVREPLPLTNALMRRVFQRSDLMMALNVPAFTDTNDFLIGVARTQGRLKKGAVPDTTAASRHVLRLWSTGELGYYSKPPGSLDAVETTRVAIEKDASLKSVILSRKEWRRQWDGKEVRLTTGVDGMLGTGKLALAKPVDVEEDEEEGEEEDDEEDDEEDEEEDDEEEDDEEDDDEELADDDA